MSVRSLLDRTTAHAARYLESVDTRPIKTATSLEELRARLRKALPEGPMPEEQVIDELVRDAEDGILNSSNGRFFGWVIGGTLPAALGADWLVSAWDQNAPLRYATPATAAIEEAAAGWLLDLLGLPPTADVGFVTGGTMANFTALAAARAAVLRHAGWDVDELGLPGAPRVHVLVGAERHDTVDLALRYLGLGRPTVVASDDEGRIRVGALAAALTGVPDGEPVIVCLQGGNVHSGAFDPFGPAIETARQRNAWVHVDGAFGLWAAAAPDRRHLVAGVENADSWATDAHKTLNVPYDCGVAIVARPADLRPTMSTYTDYLIATSADPGDPFEKVPELSRRARGVPVWAALRSLGRDGVTALASRLAARATALAVGMRTIPGATVLNDVVFTQVCVAFEDDERTRAVIARLLAEGETWMSGSRWRGREVLRISVSNWSTDEDDVLRSLEAVRRAAVT